MAIKHSRIGVLTGGGDCAGLNSAVKWVVNTALDSRMDAERGIRYEVLGIKDGWKGLSYNSENRDEYIETLTREKVSVWDREGGTNLGTSRYNPYSSKINSSKLVIDNIKQLGLDVLIAIGGDDTLTVAAKLSKDGINVVGIPKTIDGDLVGTDYTLGFNTASEVITDIVDKLRTTAGSHRRIMVIEVMGRNAGWLALRSGEASGASIILIPEHDFSLERVHELIMEKRKAGARSDIILVAEGAKPAGGKLICKDGKVDSFGHETLGGIGDFLANEASACLGLESRSVVLGHIQRGGIPSAYDRQMGRYFGIAAVNLASRGEYGKMVSYLGGKITAVPIEDVIGKLKLVDVTTMYDVQEYNGTRKILA
ncbi:MAG: ATP-dependent 6-phosphofructokinase [Dehalococcoidales bacterium]|nr:ATP-dependent 6-phosphofructokinase [Dehalococcoidales bacterium]